MKFAENKLSESNGTVNVETQEGLENSFGNNSDFGYETIGNTVDSLISGHHWGKDYCSLIRGVHLLESL